MKTSAKRISEIAIIAVMLSANLSCTKDFIQPKVSTGNVFVGMMKVTPINGDSTIKKDIGRTVPSK